MLKLISMAYSVNTDQVVGGSAWLTTDRFDIAAKASSRQASSPALLEMLRALLAARFGLVVHQEQKDMPVYLLAVGKKGPKLHATDDPQAPDCPSVNGDPALNHRACRAYSMADLSKLLPQVAQAYLDHPVVDTTGLDGFYDFQLDWMSKSTYLAVKANPDGQPAVSLFDGLEKLGLKLESGTRPTPVIVVDRVNPSPTETSSSIPAEFEAADVRPSKQSTERQGLTALPGGQLEILGYTLRELITLAFEVKADRVTGGPKWLDADRFDVIAKTPEAMSPHAIGGMLRALIVQRFKLETHGEDQPLPVFALILGKQSPHLPKSSGSERSECNLRLAEKGRVYVCRNTTMAELADRLPYVAQAYLIHPLVDLTGLKDSYDFTLTWTPRNQLSRAAPAGQASTPDGALTVFEAVDKQLGLKIEQQKHPLPVIVIDQVQRNL